MSINSNALYQFFKYFVYVMLAMNVYWFFDEEMTAAGVQFPHGIAAGDLIEAFSSTIDTAAWVVLLLMFELETYVLEDRHFTARVTWTLHGLRALCYVIIVYAFFGYMDNLAFLYEATMLEGVRSACALLPEPWSWATTLDEYAELTLANCASFAPDGTLYRFRDIPAVVDLQGLTDIRRLAWVDVINSAVWLLVLLVLEIDVRLQQCGRFEGVALAASSAAKVLLYALLLLAAVYWGIKGDFVDFWDAFLWLVAFVFIELNIFEWRREEMADNPAVME